MFFSQQVDGYTAGVDYPAYESVPKGLSFKCRNRLPGYYADTETRCQVYELRIIKYYISHMFISSQNFTQWSHFD